MAPLHYLHTLSFTTSTQVQTVYESTFVGLQALAAHFPRGSPEYQAAESALMELLGSVVTSLKGVYGDDVLYQVGCVFGCNTKLSIGLVLGSRVHMVAATVGFVCACVVLNAVGKSFIAVELMSCPCQCCLPLAPPKPHTACR